ncbi:lysyl oxidase homolog 2 [Acyrthosiphon pisum]|uniref:SRCR domain-containing protein n=1 Tax=Acyrthosiphon pisum TaxID=7029 RepID=A0A8R1X0N4_ACYPI|nr:lysyl oxidase homolog 2 [Acyrthosiphon pisum]|eukprot:XP_008178980.2 PREDICTED: lysyl oxidase homolog 2 [Acyrthosiphon pisum]
MVTTAATSGYRGLGSRTSNGRRPAAEVFMVVSVLVLGLLSLVGPTVDCRRADKRRHHWKANVIKNYLKNHKSLEGMVRLVDGESEYEGNVEIMHLGKWGAICDDEWDSREGQVVCRQLGYNGTSRVTHSSHFGQTARKYWMDNTQCGGQELEISECRFDSWGENDCDPSEAAGVVCESSEPEKPKIYSVPAVSVATKKVVQKYRIKDTSGSDIELRLVGGRTSDEGRVEANTSDGWGVICGDGFGVLEALVVCRSIGLGYAAAAFQTDRFGGLDLPVVLSAVECAGNESSLAGCYHQHKATCSTRKETVAAVVCTRDMADLEVNADELMRSAYLEDRQMYFLQCAMEENCLASSAYQLRRDETDWHLITRRLLRFTAKITNVGTAPFRPAVPKHLWQFHQCHMHYHSMEVFATFDVLDGGGMKVAEGHKASFCLEDNQCTDGAKPGFACANYGDQGISVNCSDIYRHNIDCQWVDVTDLNPGLYTLKVSVNPEHKIPEMTYANNAAVCSMFYSETFVKIYDCVLQNP